MYKVRVSDKSKFDKFLDKGAQKLLETNLVLVG